MTGYRKKLIEVALPLEAISNVSAYEKMPGIGAHPRGLHQWWARRPLAACRAVIFASLVDDPDDPGTAPEFVEACRALPRGKNAAAADTPRQRLFDFIELLVQWESTANESVLETARHLIRLATGGNPPPLLDPFAGGGSIPLEAQRLGLKAHASDLNPVAVMINKALIEIPACFNDSSPVNPYDRKGTAGTGDWKGATGLAADVRYYSRWILEQAKNQIGQLYPTGPRGETVIAWLWGRTVKCPNPACGVQMPLVRSFVLSSKKGVKTWIKPLVDPSTNEISFSIQVGRDAAPKGSIDSKGATCLVCGTAVPFEYIRGEGRAGRIDVQLLAIVTRGSRGRTYHAAIPEHERIAISPIPKNVPDTDLPNQALGFRIQAYGITKHYALFTARQLTAITTFCSLIDDVKELVRNDALAAGLTEDPKPLAEGGTEARAYTDALGVYLALVLSRVTNFNNSMAKWVSSNEKIMPVFSRQAISMTWDYGEANVLEDVVGGWTTCAEYIADCVELLRAQPPGFAYQADAAASLQESSGALISTDPPYYDNISYGDLADFFYIWLRWNLKGIYPDIFSTVLVPKDAELIASPSRFNGDANAANEHFESGLTKAFTSMRKTASREYPLTVYYAFKQVETEASDEELGTELVSSSGWETILKSLIQAGFSISGTWPIRTESTKALKANLNFLASSIVLVCRPRQENAPRTTRADFIKLLRTELPGALHEMQSGNIAPVDLAQASIGPGMAVYSRYSQVLEPNGERLSVRTALQIINQVLDAYLAEQEGDLDADSRFAVAWFEQYGFREAEFGVADVLARAKNTSVEGLAHAGVLKAGAGKVQLYHWSELDPGWDPATDKRVTTWEATHHLIERLNNHGEAGAAMLLAKMPAELAASARGLAYRLYSICERKGWAEIARDYNALVISWGASQEQAVQIREQYQQGTLF